MSDWWLAPENVDRYIDMTVDYTGASYFDYLCDRLPPGSSLLELGMGPGKDLEILSRRYRTTGSDLSPLFLDLYRNKHPDADLLLLDAVELKLPDPNRRFDCIYSNKVLHHLKPDELKASFERQISLLNPGGVLFHSFWSGDGDEVFDGLYFCYWQPSSLAELYPTHCRLESVLKYQEENPGDSFLIVLTNS